jgi:hypothetical protein
MAERGPISFYTLTFSNEALGVEHPIVFENRFIPPDSWDYDFCQSKYVAKAKHCLRMFQKNYSRKWGNVPTLINRIELGGTYGRVHIHCIGFSDEVEMVRETWNYGHFHVSESKWTGDEWDVLQLDSVSKITSYLSKYMAKDSGTVFRCPSTLMEIEQQPIYGNTFSIPHEVRQWVKDSTYKFETEFFQEVEPYLQEIEPFVRVQVPMIEKEIPVRSFNVVDFDAVSNLSRLKLQKLEIIQFEASAMYPPTKYEGRQVSKYHTNPTKEERQKIGLAVRKWVKSGRPSRKKISPSLLVHYEGIHGTWQLDPCFF